MTARNPGSVLERTRTTRTASRRQAEPVSLADVIAVVATLEEAIEGDGRRTRRPRRPSRASRPPWSRKA